MKQLLPSMLACNYAQFGHETERLLQCGISLVHYDVMDGHFVKKISFGDDILDAVLKTGMHADVHLMVTNPADQIPLYVKQGVDMITFHQEAAGEKTSELLRMIISEGIRAGVSINPETNLNVLLPYLNEVDHILIMGVHPGLGGQKLIPQCVDKVRALKRALNDTGAKTLIEFDGGATTANASVLFEAGVDMLVAGSAVFRSDDIRSTIDRMLG